MSLPGLLALLVLLSTPQGPAATPSLQAADTPAGCVGAHVALERGDLERAREAYLDALTIDASERCAVEGLQEIVRRSRAEARLCAAAKVLAAEGKEAAARRRYVDALRLDNTSECGAAGLAAIKEAQANGGKGDGKEEKGSLEKASDTTTNLLKLIGTVIIALFVTLGFVLMLVLLWRRRRPSLAIEPFADGGVEPKVGAAVAGLVEQRLTEISRAGRRADDGYQLDVAVTDVELVAANKSLETALGSLAEASQLTLVAAVMGLADRMYGTHLVASGELLPKGGNRHGVIAALQSERKGLQARGTLWKNTRESAKNPKPYYELAEPTAAWVQYEAARSLNSRVSLITTSAESFSLLSLGIAEQRARRPAVAAERYAEALGADPENVAALFNLGGILMTDDARFWKGFELVIRARAILAARYEEGL